MQTSSLDLDNRHASLSAAGDPLEPLNAANDWEIFRPVLARIDAKERKSAAGRKPTCCILKLNLGVCGRDEALIRASSTLGGLDGKLALF